MLLAYPMFVHVVVQLTFNRLYLFSTGACENRLGTYRNLTVHDSNGIVLETITRCKDLVKNHPILCTREYGLEDGDCCKSCRKTGKQRDSVPHTVHGKVRHSQGKHDANTWKCWTHIIHNRPYLSLCFQSQVLALSISYTKHTNATNAKLSLSDTSTYRN